MLQCGSLFEFSGGRCITMIEDGHSFGLMLALRHLLGRLESKGMMSYPETQRMLDQALADVKRLRIEDKVLTRPRPTQPKSSANWEVAICGMETPTKWNYSPAAWGALPP